MVRLFTCIRDDHDVRLIILAGLICVASTLAAVVLLRYARSQDRRDRDRWLAAAGITTGFGIWATHFIAMLGYDPGIIAGYAAAPTILSLVVAAVATSLGFRLALLSRQRLMRLESGVVVGLGIAAMHYLGMQAVHFPGYFTWSTPFIAASVLFAILPTIPAINLAVDHDGPASAIGASLLLVAAILLLHFTGMAGLGVVPMADAGDDGAILSPFRLGLAIAGAAAAVLTFSAIAVTFSNRARNAIRRNEREFKMLVQGISDCAIYMLDTDGRVASWNAGAERLKGYSAEEAVGLPVSTFYSAEDRAGRTAERMLATARTLGKVQAEGWRCRKDGSRFWAHVTLEPVNDDRGTLIGYAKITRDMSRLKEDQDRLAELTTNLDAALSNMRQGLCLFDADGRMVIANARVGEIFSVNIEDCPIGTPFAEVLRLGLERRAGGPISDEMLEEVVRRHHECIDQPEGGTLVVPFTDNCTLAVSHRPMPGGGWVTTFDDITDRRRAEMRMEHMALHDGLTGLPNRANYNERLDAELQRAERSGARLAVIGIDLDRFKEINDQHGHAVGDAVLKQLADRMIDAQGSDEVVARFGGDEFAAFKSFRDETVLTDFVARLEQCLSAPIEIEGITIFPGASLGIAVCPTDGRTREQIVNNADLAMYRAKGTIGRRICYYEQGMDEAARARRLLAGDLREALNREELSVVYQVQRSLATDDITGYEALVRWQHPRLGFVSPAEFIPIAEESGDILRIGEWVMRTACAEAATWNNSARIAVNLSPVQLMHVGLAGIVTRALLDSGLPPSRLELEITETALVADKIRALHVLRQIKAMGVTIAIDDFGTGYSSLDTLNSFPFDKIKIDKSFLLESDTSHQARAIIRAVLALGRSLEVPVLAEGLESENQLSLLRAEGCDEAQGYLFGRPGCLHSGQAPVLRQVASA